MFQTEGTAVTDPPDLDVTRIDRRLDAVGVGTRRRRPERGWRLVVESFMGPRVVIGPPKGIENPLLEIEVGRRRLRGPWL